MIQRILYRALTAGLALIKEDPTILDDIFVQNYGLDQTESNAVKTFFGRSPPQVIHGFARTDQKPPLYSIVLADERETDSVLNDDAGIIEEMGDPDFGADKYAAFWSHTYNIICVAEHPEACQYIYEVAKTIILTAKPTLIPEGIYGSQLSGTELMPDPRYMPENFFVRQLSFNCKRELLTLDRKSKFTKAFKLAGLHVDKSGSPSDVGKVETLITVASGEEDT